MRPRARCASQRRLDLPSRQAGRFKAQSLMSLPIPPTKLCWSCLHFHGEGYTPPDFPEEWCDAGIVKCDAFPEGMPEAIRRDEFDHDKPHPGDHGLQYVSRPAWQIEKREFPWWPDYEAEGAP